MAGSRAGPTQQLLEELWDVCAWVSAGPDHTALRCQRQSHSQQLCVFPSVMVIVTYPSGLLGPGWSWSGWVSSWFGDLDLGL